MHIVVYCEIADRDIKKWETCSKQGNEILPCMYLHVRKKRPNKKGLFKSIYLM